MCENQRNNGWQRLTLQDFLDNIDHEDFFPFVCELGEITRAKELPLMLSALASFKKWLKTAEDYNLARFRRMVHDLKLDEVMTEKMTADKYAEFFASVFVAMEQSVNFQASLFEFLQLYKILNSRQK